MKAYHKARVIHDIDRSFYRIETARHWWSMWEHHQTIMINSHVGEQECLAIAKEKCESLVKQVVVFEAS